MKFLDSLMTFTILGASSATGLGIGYLSRGEERETQKGYIVSVEPVDLLDETIWKDGVIDNNLKDETSCKEKNGRWIPKTEENQNEKACYTPKNPKQPSQS